MAETERDAAVAEARVTCRAIGCLTRLPSDWWMPRLGRVLSLDESGVRMDGPGDLMLGSEDVGLTADGCVPWDVGDGREALERLCTDGGFPADWADHADRAFAHACPRCKGTGQAPNGFSGCSRCRPAWAQDPRGIIEQRNAREMPVQHVATWAMLGPAEVARREALAREAVDGAYRLDLAESTGGPPYRRRAEHPEHLRCDRVVWHVAERSWVGTIAAWSIRRVKGTTPEALGPRFDLVRDSAARWLLANPDLIPADATVEPVRAVHRHLAPAIRPLAALVASGTFLSQIGHGAVVLTVPRFGSSTAHAGVAP